MKLKLWDHSSGGPVGEEDGVSHSQCSSEPDPDEQTVLVQHRQHPGTEPTGSENCTVCALPTLDR